MSYSNLERVNRIALDLIRIEQENASKVMSKSDDRASVTSDNPKAGFNRKNYNFLLSDVEKAVLHSQEPIEMPNETHEIAYGDERGIWINRDEVNRWRGDRPINEYPLNYDPNPQIITKKSTRHLQYVQELAVRYLQPPTPEMSGDIIIKQLSNEIAPPAPPLIIRQQPVRQPTPEPIVIREAPPPMPKPVGRKIITIGGRKMIPPPRKVVIERLPTLPSKPQSVIIERWLPYKPVKRRVIYKRENDKGEMVDVVKTKNVIIEWSSPDIRVNKELIYLGVTRADPKDYRKKYGDTLKDAEALPSIVKDIKPPNGIVLAADEKQHNSNLSYDLEGDIHALNYIDLDKEGLSEYKSYLKQNRKAMASSTPITTAPAPAASTIPSENYYLSSFDSFDAIKAEYVKSEVIHSSENETGSSNTEVSSSNSLKKNLDKRIVDRLIEQIFQIVDTRGDGRISVDEAQRTLTRINSRMSKQFDEAKVVDFFNTLNNNNDGQVDLKSFRKAFLKISESDEAGSGVP